MLTERKIRDAKPGAKPSFMWDAVVKGLGVKVNPSGSHTFVLQYRQVTGKTRRATLGRVGELSLKAAREIAGKELVTARDGGADIASRRRETKEAPTVADLWQRFEREHAPARIANGRMTAETLRNYASQAGKYILPALGNLQVTAVKRGDVAAMVAPLAGTVQHNRLLALTSRLFTLAEHWELRPQHTNPARGIERAREDARDRVLSPTELGSLAAALADVNTGSPAAVAAIFFAAVTGLRIGEVLAMRWEHIDREAARLLLPDTKTGRRTHDLADDALAVLDTLPKINGWCFTIGRDAPITYKTARTVFGQATKAAGLADVHLHDLRRTVMTNAAIAGVGTHVLRDLLGHRTTAMADRYIRAVGNPVREAREQIGAAMAGHLRLR